MKKRPMISILVGVLMAAMLPAVAAGASPDKFETRSFLLVHYDEPHELVLFSNMSRAELCTPWVVAFEAFLLGVGPDPGPGSFPEGRKAISVQDKVTGKGAIVEQLKASDLYAEAWEANPGPIFGLPCADTADKMNLVATGTTSTVRGNDNDAAGSGTRASSHTVRAKTLLTDASGNEYRYTIHFHFNDRCFTPDGTLGSAACWIRTDTLRPKN
jgi:hypothetical protein